MKNMQNVGQIKDQVTRNKSHIGGTNNMIHEIEKPTEEEASMMRTNPQIFMNNTFQPKVAKTRPEEEIVVNSLQGSQASAESHASKSGT